MSEIAVTQKFLISALLLSAFASSDQSKNRASAQPVPFIIDQNRPYVYLRFDHTGKGPKFYDDEPATRLWFRFVNNCRVGIVLRAFGVPEGSPKDEVGVMHEVVRDKVVRDGAEVLVFTPPATSGPPRARDSQKQEQMPAGYDFHVSTAETIAPGESLLFSIPVTHLSRAWHIEIPFEFDLPPGKGPRPPAIGGQPEMVLTYFVGDLPNDVSGAVPTSEMMASQQYVRRHKGKEHH